MERSVRLLALGALGALAVVFVFAVLPASGSAAAIKGRSIALAARTSPRQSETAPMIRVGHVRPGYGPLFGGAVQQSGNWAGYDAIGGGFHSVTASWTQPSVLAVNSENAASCYWVGLDGDGSSSVEQCGTEADDTYGTVTYYAWYEMYPAPETLIPEMTITPGDTMTASVTTDGVGDFAMTLIDDTTDVSKTVTAHSAAKGYSAEVIAEAPTDATTGTEYPLADFGTMDFSNCTINSKPIADAAWRQIDMVDQSSTPLATPSPLGPDGSSFSVACDQTPPSTPVPGWQTQYQGTTGSPYFNGVGFGSSSVGAAVGNSMVSGWSGTIYGTTDGGSAWGEPFYQDATNTMNGVAFTSADDGWAVGGNSGASPHGIILATTDGGANWNPQYTDTSDYLLGVSFVNANDGWAVGGDGSGGGVILATTDGGTDWSVQYRGSSPYLYSVSFANSQDGWAVGERDVILSTTDGGTDWTRQNWNATSTSHLSGVAFANANDGWAVGDDGVFDTTDGGTTWSLLQSVGSATGVTCANAHDVWLVAGSNIVASANGGATWISQYSFPTYDLTLKAIAYADSNHLWAVGGSPDLGGGTILATTDGGWPTPTGLGVSPVSGMIGSSVVLTGTGLTSATSVEFDGVSAHFTADSDTQITATVPAGATSGPVIVTTPGGTVVSSDFTVVGPTLASFTPQSGRLRDLVTLVGKGLTGATAVKFNGQATSSFTVTGDTLITASVPFGATSGRISVTSPAGVAVSASSFTVLATTARLSLAVSGLAHGQLRLGGQLVVKATLSPANLAGCRVTVVLQRKRSGEWRTLTSSVRSTNSLGRCNVSYKPGGRGTYRVRVSIGATSTNTAAATAWRAFTIT